MNVKWIKFFIALIFIMILLDAYFIFSESRPRWDEKFAPESAGGGRFMSNLAPSRKGAIDNFLSPIIDEISRQPQDGSDAGREARYEILDSAEVAAYFSKNSGAPGLYFESSDFTGDPVVFIRRVTVRAGGDIYAKIEVKRDRILKFPGVFGSKPFMFFVIIIVLSCISIYFIFSYYRTLVAAQAESQKHQSVQRMSRGLAHEIRNPLNAMRMSLEMIGRGMDSARLEKKEDVAEYMGILKSEIMRLDGLVNRFMEYSKDVVLNVSDFSIKTVVEPVVRTAAPLAMEKGATIGVSGDADTVVRADAGLIYQCVLNVLKNALESVESGGKIEIGCRSVQGGCEIIVTDDGPGIPEDNIEKVFDFYFSTKSEGSGIGLALTKKFVEAHGGSINVSSRKGATSFAIYLPVKNERGK